MKKCTMAIMPIATLICFTLSAWAQQPATGLDREAADEDAMATGEGMADELPEPISDYDPAPPVARVMPPKEGVVKQAGVGGVVAYGRPGVLELGGSAGVSMAAGFMAVNINPMVGWFVTDNLEISTIMGLEHVSTQRDEATIFRLLVEPSYHLPFSRRLFGFLGIGFGGAYADGPGFGMALAPRFGANIMVGRSGILSPSLSYQYTTHDSLATMDGSQYVAVSTALTANIGYTVMW